jgi:hypothetical protein
VAASLGYLGATPERPFNYMYQPPVGTPWQNCEYTLQRMHVADARAIAARPSIDREGYELWDAPTGVADFADEAAIRRYYYAEAAELARWVTGARQAWVFDHLVRRREAGRPALGFGRQGDGSNPAAVGRVHNDYSEASGRRRLELVLTDPAELARVERFAIVNIWRSIRGPVLDTPWPSATPVRCRPGSGGGRDPLPGAHRRDLPGPPRRPASMGLLSGHGPSRGPDLQAVRLPDQRHGPLHAPFGLRPPDVPPDTPLRESIEVRCLVVFE